MPFQKIIIVAIPTVIFGIVFLFYKPRIRYKELPELSLPKIIIPVLIFLIFVGIVIVLLYFLGRLLYEDVPLVKRLTKEYEGVVYGSILTAFGFLFWAFLKGVFKVFAKVFFEGKPLIPEKLKSKRFSIKPFRIIYLKFEYRFSRKQIILISDIPSRAGNFLYNNLFVKLNAISRCDYLRRSTDLRKKRYKLAVVLATHRFSSSSGLYSTEEAKFYLESELEWFLGNGNYLITVHDCHFWGSVGVFEPPMSNLAIKPIKHHPITKYVEPFNLDNQDGPYGGTPLRPYPCPGVSDYKVLFHAKVKTWAQQMDKDGSQLPAPKFDAAPFPAAWLLKYKSFYYNVFYWFPAHSDDTLINEDFIQVILNAARYFIKR